MTWKNLKLLSETVPTVVAVTDFELDVLSSQPDADVTITSDTVLPQLDVSVTDLASILDQLEQTSGHRKVHESPVLQNDNGIITVNGPKETEGNILPFDKDPTGEQSDNQLSSDSQKRFPFSNSSHPEDSDADILPYPTQISRKPKNRAKPKSTLS